jgi:hypothetical protein
MKNGSNVIITFYRGTKRHVFVWKCVLSKNKTKMTTRQPTVNDESMNSVLHRWK